MKRKLSRFWFLGLPCLLLSMSAAQSDFCQNNLPPSNPDAVYIDHGDGTVTDTRTGLMWKQCAEGLSDATCQTGSAQTFPWRSSLAQAEAGAFAEYSDWRLPNAKELLSLVEACRVYPAINANFFPNTPLSPIGFGGDSRPWFWSSSPSYHHSNAAWVVEFRHGNDGNKNRRSSFSVGHVRLVRGGQ